MLTVKSKLASCARVASFVSLLLFLLPAVLSLGHPNGEGKTITVRGQVELERVIVEEDMLIPAETLHNYIMLDTTHLDMEKVSPSTVVASVFGWRLGFLGLLEYEGTDGELHHIAHALEGTLLDEHGRFETQIELKENLIAIYMVSGDHVIRLKDKGEDYFRVYGIHELDMEADKDEYEVEIDFQVLLPQAFPGVVKILNGGEGVTGSVYYMYRLGERTWSDRAEWDTDGVFMMTMPPFEGIEVRLSVRGLSWIEFALETMRKDWVSLRDIMERGLVISVEKRPTPDVKFVVEIVDSQLRPLEIEEQQRSVFQIGFLPEGAGQEKELTSRSDGERWQAIGRGEVYYWDMTPGERELLAWYSLWPRKILPETVQIKDLDEEDKPQIIEVQIIHEP